MIKNRKEFIERIEGENPELAKRYSAYLSQKRELLTSQYAFNQLIVEEAESAIKENLMSLGVADIDRVELAEVSRDFIAIKNYERMESKSANPPQIPFEVDIDAFSIIYAEFIGKKSTLEGATFTDFLNIRIEGDNPVSSRFPLAILWYMAIAIKSGKIPVDRFGEKTNRFYLDQFKRLENERALYTQTAEDVFLPFLNSSTIGKPSGIFHGIIAHSGACVPLTVDEMWKVVDETGNDDLREKFSLKKYIFENGRVGHLHDIHFTHLSQIMFMDQEDVASLSHLFYFFSTERLAPKESYRRLRVKTLGVKDSAYTWDGMPEYDTTGDRFALYLFSLARRRGLIHKEDNK